MASFGMYFKCFGVLLQALKIVTAITNIEIFDKKVEIDFFMF